MIYKYEQKHGQIVKIRPNGTWTYYDIQGGGYEHGDPYEPCHGLVDLPSCLLEVTLLRPELDYT